MDPIKAGEYTPYEIGLMCESANESRQGRIDELLFVAWHTEAFARHKRLPSLENVLKEAHKKKGTITRADAILIAMANEKGVKIK